MLWLVTPAGFWAQAVAFGLFRLFDAATPGPVAWADALYKIRRGQPIGWPQGFAIMLDDLFGPYVVGGEARVTVHGDDAAIAARAATPLALVFHELATNSAKYGALSTEDGAIDLTITDQGEHMLLRWVERGGPPPAGEHKAGFGSRLVEISLTGQLGGSWERHFEPEGLVCELVVSKAAIAR